MTTVTAWYLSALRPAIPRTIGSRATLIRVNLISAALNIVKTGTKVLLEIWGS
jgi:hypothetical protein